MLRKKEWPEIKLGENFIIELDNTQERDKLLEMSWIPPSTFLSGSPETEAGRHPNEMQSEVRIYEGFWISKYPITHFHWFSSLNLTNELDSLNPHHRNIPKGIRWYEAMMFCWEQNRKSFYGRRGFEEVKRFGYRFSLPTELQWEYACRAGTQSRFYNGNDIDKLAQIAWYKDNSENSIHPVGEKAANNWGIYDMLGNVQEWCLDVFTEYPNHSGNSSDEPLYNVRGGDIFSEAKDVRCASRAYVYPFVQTANVGFRLCLSNIKYEAIFY